MVRDAHGPFATGFLIGGRLDDCIPCTSETGGEMVRQVHHEREQRVSLRTGNTKLRTNGLYLLLRFVLNLSDDLAFRGCSLAFFLNWVLRREDFHPSSH